MLNQPRLVSGAVISATVAFMLWGVVPWDTALGRAAQDASHVLASGVIALASLWLIRSQPSARRIAPTISLCLAFAVAFGAGVLVELAQGLGNRSPSAEDLARNAAGAASFLLLAFALGPLRTDSRTPRWTRVAAGLAAGAVLALSLAELAAWTVAYADRDRAFPSLCRFDDAELLRFVSANGARLEVVSAPVDWSEASGAQVGRLTLDPVRDPGITIEEPYPDWRGYAAVEIAAYNPEPEILELTLRVHDALHDGRYADRFNRRLSFAPGASRVRIALDELARAPAGRRLDLGRIAGVILFAPGTQRPRTLYLDEISLE